MEADPLLDQLVDPIIAAAGWIGGLMLLGVAASLVGLAWWWAGAMERLELARVIARGFLAALGIALTLVGAWGVAIGTEAAAGYPLGPQSGGTALLAYWLTLSLASRDLSLTAALLRRGGHPWLAGLAACGAAGAYALGKVMALFVLVVAFAVLIG